MNVLCKLHLLSSDVTDRLQLLKLWLSRPADMKRTLLQDGFLVMLQQRATAEQESKVHGPTFPLWKWS